MPDICRENVPVLEWCDIRQAVRWIVLYEEPVDYENEILRAYALVNPNRLGEREQNEATGLLFRLCCDGKVTLRGKPAVLSIVTTKNSFSTTY